METQSTLSAILNDQSANSFLTPKAASEYLGVSKETLSVWRCTGRYAIPYLKVGRLVKYRKSDLDEWLEKRTHGVEV